MSGVFLFLSLRVSFSLRSNFTHYLLPPSVIARHAESMSWQSHTLLPASLSLQLSTINHEWVQFLFIAALAVSSNFILCSQSPQSLRTCRLASAKGRCGNHILYCSHLHLYISVPTVYNSLHLCFCIYHWMSFSFPVIASKH
jgi:hypothetical protein